MNNTDSFLGTWVFIILIGLRVDASIASWIGTLTIFGLRVISVRYRVTLALP